MSFIAAAVIGAGGALLGGALASSGAKSAAQTQASAATAAAELAAKQRQPWVDAGSKALDRLSAGLAPGGEYAQKFSMADAQNMPAMKFTLDQGLQSIGNAAAAKGGLLSTNAIQDSTKYAEGVASTFENQAFNQWLAQQQQQLGAQQSLAGLGQTMASQTADTGANALLAAGGAQAAGQVGAANAWGNALGSVSNQLQQFGVLKSLFSPSSGGGFSAFDTSGAGIDPTGMLGGASTAGDYSDERLKDDVRQVGTTNDGLPIYTYRMKFGGPTKMGVMAQDMERVRPDAVTRDRAGFRMVDYNKVS